MIQIFISFLSNNGLEIILCEYWSNNLSTCVPLCFEESSSFLQLFRHPSITLQSYKRYPIIFFRKSYIISSVILPKHRVLTIPLPFCWKPNFLLCAVIDNRKKIFYHISSFNFWLSKSFREIMLSAARILILSNDEWSQLLLNIFAAILRVGPPNKN